MKVYIVFIEDELKVFDNENRALKFYNDLLAIDNRNIRLEEHDVIPTINASDPFGAFQIGDLIDKYFSPSL